MRVWCSGNTPSFQVGITGSNPVTRFRKISSAVEHLVYTEAVGGSIPSSCITKIEQCYESDANSAIPS